MILIRFLIIFLAFAMGSVSGWAQAKGDLRKEFPTETIDFKKDANRSGNRPKRKQIHYIYKATSEGVLYGNPCAVQATRKMGFEYVLQPAGVPGSPDEKEVELNNFLVNLKLIFTKSPFWKMILNKRIKDCREKSGDFVG